MKSKECYFSPLNYSGKISPKSKKKKKKKGGRHKKDKCYNFKDIETSGPALYEQFEYGMSDW